LLAKRAKTKSSSFYSNASWDLVDALSEGEMDEAELQRINDAQLPETMRGLSSAKKLDYVREKAQARDKIKSEIGKLSAQRDAFVAKARREQTAEPSMGEAMTSAVKQQAEQKRFVFEK
jgi:hypothetical protein